MKNSLKSLKDIFLKGAFPKQLVVQICDNCNADCPQCGMNKGNNFKRSRLSPAKIKEIIDKASDSGVHAISFTGGEPFLYESDLLKAITYATNKNIVYTRTGTNGFMFTNSKSAYFEDRIKSLAEKIKKSGLYTFWISIDTYDIEKHEKNRGLKGVIDGVEKGLKIFESFDLYPSVNLGINRLIEDDDYRYYKDGNFHGEIFYESYVSGLRKFFNFAAELGFTISNMCYPMSSDNAVYKAESKDQMVSYSKEERILIFKSLLKVIPEFREKIRIFTPLSSVTSIINHYEKNSGPKFPCYGGDFYFFISSTSGLYPCGFKNDNCMGNYENLGGTPLRLNCTDCDWECFRDPSNLIAPLINIRTKPIEQIKDFIRNREFYKTWLRDISYFRRCNFFDMRTRFRPI